MPDIFHTFPVKATVAEVFAGVTSPAGLDAWWTKKASGNPDPGSTYQLFFAPGYDWRAAVTRSVPGNEFELELTGADPDWLGTKVGFKLTDLDGITQVEFSHTGWPEANEHFRVSGYCWAMYLRILKRYLEFGETVPYELRLDV
jgi:uncharacterized protein YndB with AHSA1/START domain